MEEMDQTGSKSYDFLELDDGKILTGTPYIWW